MSQRRTHSPDCKTHDKIVANDANRQISSSQDKKAVQCNHYLFTSDKLDKQDIPVTKPKQVRGLGMLLMNLELHKKLINLTFMNYKS